MLSLEDTLLTSCLLPNRRAQITCSLFPFCCISFQCLACRQKVTGKQTSVLKWYSTQHRLNGLHMCNPLRQNEGDLAMHVSILFPSFPVHCNLKGGILLRGGQEAFVVYQDQPLLHKHRTKLSSASEKLWFGGGGNPEPNLDFAIHVPRTVWNNGCLLLVHVHDSCFGCVLPTLLLYDWREGKKTTHTHTQKKQTKELGARLLTSSLHFVHG